MIPTETVSDCMSYRYPSAGSDDYGPGRADTDTLQLIPPNTSDLEVQWLLVGIGLCVVCEIPGYIP